MSSQKDLGFSGNKTDIAVCAGSRERPAIRLSRGRPFVLPLPLGLVVSQSVGPHATGLLVPLAQGSCPCLAFGHLQSLLEARAVPLTGVAGSGFMCSGQDHGIKLLFAQEHSNLKDL